MKPLGATNDSDEDHRCERRDVACPTKSRCSNAEKTLPGVVTNIDLEPAKIPRLVAMPCLLLSIFLTIKPGRFGAISRSLLGLQISDDLSR